MTTNPIGDTLILGVPGIEGKTTAVPSHAAVNAFNEEKHQLATHDGELEKAAVLEPEIKAALPSYESAEKDDDDHVIITGADAAAHLLPMRDDQESALTFRSIFLASILSAFQAVVYQIYQVCSSPGLLPTIVANGCVSSNRLLLTFREPSLSSWLTSLALHGLNYFPVEINSRLDGELKAVLAKLHSTSK